MSRTQSEDEIYVLFNKRNLKYHSTHNTMKSVRLEQSQMGNDYVWTTRRNWRINIKPRAVYFEENKQ